MGSTDCELTLNTAGDVLTGSASAMGVTSTIQDGSVDGNAFSFTTEGDGPLGHMRLDISGVVDGDHITGTIALGRIKAAFEGTRV